MKRKERTNDTMTFMKGLVIVNHVCALSWVYMTYLLAFLDKIEIVQSLAITVVAEVIAVTGLYALKSLLENLSKNNTWPDKIKMGVEENSNLDRDM